MNSPALPLPSGPLLAGGRATPSRDRGLSRPLVAIATGAAETLVHGPSPLAATNSSAQPLMAAPYCAGGATQRRWGLLVLGLHLALVWGLLQMKGVRQALHEATPLMVNLISPAAPERPPEAPPLPKKPLPSAPSPLAVPVPQVVVADAPPAPPPTPAPVVAIAPAAVAAPPAPVPAVVTAPAVAPSPPPAPAPKAVSASSLRYRVVPPVEVPLASRRLGESGTVALRVIFDVTGAPRQIALLRSSGHARLDEQALAAMRAARIVPYLDNGTPIEVSAVAQLAYELD